jgi:hypothetical protein
LFWEEVLELKGFKPLSFCDEVIDIICIEMMDGALFFVVEAGLGVSSSGRS